MARHSSKEYWNHAARDNAAWYIATGFTRESDEFFELGSGELDHFLGAAGVSLHHDQTVVEIGCGVGRMTRRMAQLAGAVIATDVSGGMIERARSNLADAKNVSFVELSGEGDLPIATASVDAVFSYITMQHVLTADGQEKYFAEAIRIVRPHGWVLMQFRQLGFVPRALDWVSHTAHLLGGRRTLSRAWRGSRISPSALSAYESASVRVHIVMSGRRHFWALADVT